MSAIAAPTPSCCRPRGLVKRYGHVTALDGADFELLPGEILAVIGDNGAGKSTPDQGAVGRGRSRTRARSCSTASRSTSAARSTRAAHGIETVYQDLAVAPALTSPRTCSSAASCAAPASSAACCACSTRSACWQEARRAHARPEDRHPLDDAGGGDAVGRPAPGRGGGARAAFAQHVVIMDEPTAALGVKEVAAWCWT